MCQHCADTDVSVLIAAYPLVILLVESEHDKTNKMTPVPSEDSNQPWQLPSLISLSCPHEATLGP